MPLRCGHKSSVHRRRQRRKGCPQLQTWICEYVLTLFLSKDAFLRIARLDVREIRGRQDGEDYPCYVSIFIQTHPDRHCVVSEDVHDLHGKFASAGGAFMGDASQTPANGLFWCGNSATRFQRCSHPSTAPPTPGLGFLYADNFAFALEVKIHRPVIDPVRPVFGQYLAGVAPPASRLTLTICPFSTAIRLPRFLRDCSAWAMESCE